MPVEGKIQPPPPRATHEGVQLVQRAAALASVVGDGSTAAAAAASPQRTIGVKRARDRMSSLLSYLETEDRGLYTGAVRLIAAQSPARLAAAAVGNGDASADADAESQRPRKIVRASIPLPPRPDGPPSRSRSLATFTDTEVPSPTRPSPADVCERFSALRRVVDAME